MEPCCSSYLWRALLSGRTRVCVPKPGRVSIIIKPAPDKLHSPVGPVAHFLQGAPKRFAQLFCSICTKGGTAAGHGRQPCSSSGNVLLLIQQPPGEWVWRRALAESTWGISATHQSIICGLTQSISPSWQLNHRGYHLMVHSGRKLSTESGIELQYKP